MQPSPCLAAARHPDRLRDFGRHPSLRGLRPLSGQSAGCEGGSGSLARAWRSDDAAGPACADQRAAGRLAAHCAGPAVLCTCAAHPQRSGACSAAASQPAKLGSSSMPTRCAPVLRCGQASAKQLGCRLSRSMFGLLRKIRECVRPVTSTSPPDPMSACKRPAAQEPSTPAQAQVCVLDADVLPGLVPELGVQLVAAGLCENGFLTRAGLPLQP